MCRFFFFQAEDGIRDADVTGIQTCALPISERCNFLEVAYLILFGELPNEEQLAAWTYDITHHTFVHENIKTLMQAFRYDAHPMGMFISTVAALSAFYPEANEVNDTA